MTINAVRIYNFSSEFYTNKSDVAIVLGAGTKNGNLSPIFKERINHSLILYRNGNVNFLLFTGGTGKRQKESDSRIAKKYAIKNGIPKEKIFIEENSSFTHTNLSNAKVIMDSLNFSTALLISDPLHMKRSISIANGIGINCKPSPTPTSMYRSKSTKLKSLIYESFFYSLGIFKGVV